jgi:signal transduction histidine kinase
MAAVELIDNALRHSGGKGGVTVEVARAKDTWTLTVADRGPGFPAHVLGEMGRPFTKGYGASGGAQRGAGLGLALAVQIARAHQGHLTVEPRAGGGSTVRLALPLPPAGEGL